MPPPEVQGNFTAEEKKKLEVMQAWAPQLQDVNLPPTERKAILAMIREGVMPDTKRIPYKISDEELRERYKDLPEVINSLESKRKIFELEQKVNQYTKESELKTSPAPGEVLRKRNRFYKKGPDGKVDVYNPEIDESIDWSKYVSGWDNEGIKKIYKELRALGALELSPMQAQVVIELFVATGNSPDFFMQNLNQQQITDDLEEARQLALQERDPRRKREPESIFYENFFGRLGIKQQDVQRYIYPSHYHNELENDYERSTPGYSEELAWQMIYKNPDKWGLTGKFPMLQMRMVKKKDGSWEGRYYINEANMVRWETERMMYWHGEAPDAPFDFQKVVYLKKEYRDLDLDTMFENEATMFKSQDGKTEYGHLVNKMKEVAWIFTDLRRKRIDYESVMNNEAELAKKIGEMFYGNSLTKSAFGKNMFYYIMTLPLNFHEPTKEDGVVSDNTLGAIIDELYLAYYNISDFKKLQGLLGASSSFFTKQGMLDALETVVRSKKTGETSRSAFLGPGVMEQFEKAFGNQDTIKDEQAFISFINIFATQFPNANHEKMVRRALMNALAAVYGKEIEKKNGRPQYALFTEDDEVDEDSLGMADVIAYSMVRPTGAGARNDVSASGFDAESKWMNAEAYRLKMATPDRGGVLGNPFTVPQYKRMMVDFMRGVVTDSPVKHGEDAKLGSKTPLEVLEQLQMLRRGQFLYIRRVQSEIDQLVEGSAERIRRQAELDDLRIELDKEYQNCAGQLEFKERTMADYYGNHLNRAFKMFTDVMSAKEFNPDQYITYDALGGVHFNREKFQEEVQEKIKDVRYLWSTYSQLNFNMPIRATVNEIYWEKGERKSRRVWKDMLLGESLFGYEMVNRKKFWQKNPDGSWAISDGRHVIDWNKVQEDKKGLFKQWVLMKFAAGFYASMSLNSTDLRKKYPSYLNMIAALESIPGGILGDEYNMRGLKISEHFFDKSDIKWLRNMARVENFDIYWRWILKSIFASGGEHGSGFMEALNLFFKGIVPTG